MWAQLQPNGVIDIIHTPREVHTPTHHYGIDVFTVWPIEDLRSILAIVPAVYVDTPPGPHYIAVAETAVLADERVMVTRIWEDRAPVSRPDGTPMTVNQITLANLELPLMQREADAVLAALTGNPSAAFARMDYVLLATLIGTAVPATGDDTADIKAAAVHVHHAGRRAAETMAAAIRQRQAGA